MKLFFLYRRSWRDDNFNYKFDGVVYAVFVSLGFAAFENIMYVFSYGLSVIRRARCWPYRRTWASPCLWVRFTAEPRRRKPRALRREDGQYSVRILCSGVSSWVLRRQRHASDGRGDGRIYVVCRRYVRHRVQPDKTRFTHRCADMTLIAL